MKSEERIKKALQISRDTKYFRLGNGVLSEVASCFKELFPGKKAVVVTDCFTWAIAGEKVYKQLKQNGIETVYYRIIDKHFHAEWKYVEMVEEAIRMAGAIAVSVGSGVINDLCKLSSHHLGQPYLCIPTAASVDGFAAFGASISYQGLKQTFDCPAPLGILADSSIIASAPSTMSASGYADLAAKIPCGAEWMIADMMGVEPIIPDAWHVLQDSLDEMLSYPEGVASGNPDAIGNLFEGLILSGIAMQCARSSRPASCTDHLFSHYLDMTEHTYKGHLQSHGFQVAIGTLTMCAFFDAFLEMDLTKLDVDACADAWPSLEDEQARAHQLFKDFFDPEFGCREMTKKYHNKETVRQQLTRMKENWPTLRDRMRKQVYPFKKMQQLFKTVGAPYDPSHIGLTRKQLYDMVPLTQMMRWRINLLDFARRACIYDELVDRVFGKGGVWELN